VLGFSPLQALPTHGVGDGVHAHRPPVLEQVSVNARRTIGAARGVERRLDRGVELAATLLQVLASDPLAPAPTGLKTVPVFA
jgi:hypothetical protein